MTSKSPLILVIEDNQQLDLLLRTTLESLNYKVISSPLGKEALIMARKHQPRIAREWHGLPSGIHDSVKVGDLTIELTKRLVVVAGQEVSLTPIEFNLLSILARHAGLVVTHRYLLEKVWGVSYIEQSHYLRVYMGQLRHKLESDPTRPKYLLTEAGVGYRLYGGEN